MDNTLRPPPYPTDDASLDRDTDVETFNPGGPGGQHKNKTQTAVRLRHRPSGTVVTASEERKLSDNLRVAFGRLRARLERLNFVPKMRRPTRPTRAARERRLSEKSKRSEVKSNRGRVKDE
ncbi:MAG: peptide chain release factor-like protein [Deltaproteobacteria bacterium]|nr:peptide chain release factor-like protein [Deltaproteobacteria bacterium]